MKVWKINMGCRTDEKLRDRFFCNGTRFMMSYKLPERGAYYVSTPNNRRDLAEEIAIRRAQADGIESPICISSEWVESQKSKSKEQMLADLEKLKTQVGRVGS